MHVGIIGCGNISDVYVRTAKLFNDIEIIACSDIVPVAAQRLAHEYALRDMKVGALLESDDIEIILNLTLPTAHAEVSRAAIAAGKHVYSEKPLATSLQDAFALIEKAEAKGLRVGCAPDTILGAGLQTAWLACTVPLDNVAFVELHSTPPMHLSKRFISRRRGDCRGGVDGPT